MCLAVQNDGKVLIGGFFGKINGEAAPWFARFNPDGAVDQDFQRHFTSGAGFTARRSVPVQSVTTAITADPTAKTGTNSKGGETIFITALTVQDGVAEIQFQASPNRTYILQARNALQTGEWFNVSTNQSGGNGFGTLRDPGAKDASVRFYQVAAP
jgi:hypothetical protein